MAKTIFLRLTFLFFLNFAFFITNLYPQETTLVNVYFSPKPTSDKSSPYRAFKNFINEAKESLYIAAYDFNIKDLSKALVNKKKAGVYVELFIEKDNYHRLESQAALRLLKKNQIKVITDERSGLMHNKYIIRDKDALLTGSLNFTVNGFFHNYNDIIIIKHKKLAETYLKNYILLTSKHHVKKYQKYYNQLSKKIILNKNESITPLFSLQKDDLIKHYKKQINLTKKNIDFLIFAFSSKAITEALEKKLTHRLKVRGIFDDSFESANLTKNWQNVPFQVLWQAGANIKYDDSTGKLHHKLMLFDKKRMITGSFNFSKNAVKRNNENLLIIKSKKITTLYKNRFNELWKKYSKKTVFEEYIILRNRKKTKLSYSAYLKNLRDKKKSLLPQVGQKISGKIIRVLSANELILKLKNKTKIKFTLSGLNPPAPGINEYNQEPQYSLSKENLILKAAQRLVVGKVFYENDREFFGVLSLKGKKETLNEFQLLTGYVYLDLKEKENLNKTQPKFWRKLVRANKKALKEKKFLYGEYALKVNPEEFKMELEKKLLDYILREKQYSEANYQPGYLIGNKKTKKSYFPSNSNYYNYLKDLKNDKLIFFKNKEMAKKAGYQVSY